MQLSSFVRYSTTSSFNNIIILPRIFYDYRDGIANILCYLSIVKSYINISNFLFMYYILFISI